MQLNINKIEFLVLSIIAIILPWSIILATPQLQIGYWGQVEGMIAFSHFMSGITSLLLIMIGFKNKIFRLSILNPLILMPILLGLVSIISALFQRLPVLSLYGSPQIGQGAFWYFSLSMSTMLYLSLMNSKKVKYVLFLNFLLLTLTVTIGSFYPRISGITVSFFGFNDWLAIYFTIFSLSLMYMLSFIKLTFKKELFGFIIFLSLGPLFWKIDNNSAIAIWIILTLAWIFWFILNLSGQYFKKIIKYLYNPYVFTFVPIFLSLVILLSSFLFWDGVTDQTDEIANDIAGGHLGTLIARGSIVRVLLDHLIDFKSIVFGYGWGSISELLLASFTPEVFYQINTGNRVHFHTHNEFFEHLFSIGILGLYLYVLYIYNIFKYSFYNSISIPFVWLLYFCIGAFWFQWVSSLAILGMFSALLILSNNFEITKSRIGNIFANKLFYTTLLSLISIFLIYGSYIGYFTAYKHMDSFRAAELIEISREYKDKNNCSERVNDYGKGAIQFSLKFNGFSNYYKDQVMLYGKLNDADYNVLQWHLCASEDIINKNRASLELINVHINTLSMLSVLPGQLGIESRIRTKNYIDLWEDKLRLLLLSAPKRIDQATPLISYYLKNNNDIGIKRICLFMEQENVYQGFCDLALGSVYLKEGNLDQGIFLIERANKMGVLDREDIDKETSNSLKNILKTYNSK